jgi:hypothetical protein
LSAENGSSAVSSGVDIDLNDDDEGSPRASLSFPTFTVPSAGTTLAVEQRDRLGYEAEVYNLDNRKASPGVDWKEDLGPKPSDSVNEVEGEWERKGISTTESDLAKDEYMMGETDHYSTPRPHSRAFSAIGMSHRRSRRAPPSLAPAIWRIILFQL